MHSMKEVEAAIEKVRPYLTDDQLEVMATQAIAFKSEFHQEQFVQLAWVIDHMPRTYQTDGMDGDAVVWLHYFAPNSDWYITELDIEDGVTQAYGFACINGDLEMAELGYISITELASVGAELDLFFPRCTLREAKAILAARITGV